MGPHDACEGPGLMKVHRIPIDDQYGFIPLDSIYERDQMLVFPEEGIGRGAVPEV